MDSLIGREFMRLMNFEEERFATFRCPLTGALKYPKIVGISIHAMATHGFYYTGTGNKVRCNFCNVELHELDPYDDIAVEHLKYSPNCPLILNHEATLNVTSFSRNSLERDLTRAKSGVYQINRQRIATYLRNATLSFNGTFGRTPRDERVYQKLLHEKKEQMHSLMVDHNEQLETALAHPHLYDAISSTDRSETYLCANASRDPNDPNIGPTNEREDVGIYVDANTVGLPLQPSPSSSSLKDTDANVLKQCVVCCVKEYNTVLMPCRHLSSCYECVQKLNKCPTCREIIKDVVKVFLS